METKELNDIQRAIFCHMPEMVEQFGDGWRNEYFKNLYKLHGRQKFFEIACNIETHFPEMKQWFKQLDNKDL